MSYLFTLNAKNYCSPFNYFMLIVKAGYIYFFFLLLQVYLKSLQSEDNMLVT